jgi:hypothetical protein
MQRKELAYFCFAVALFSWTPCNAQIPTATLAIEIPKRVFARQTPIRLDVIVKNTSTVDLDVWKANPHVNGQAEAYITITVRDSDGRSMPRIDGVTFVKNGKQYGIGKRWLTRKAMIVRPNLSSKFDLSKPGTYTVSGEADIPVPDSGPEIKWIQAFSNKISFAVKQ